MRSYLECRRFLELSLFLRDDESETGGLPGLVSPRHMSLLLLLVSE